MLKSLGVKKGDRVAVYLPMIPELAIIMLACARIGAPHSVVFGGFSPDSLADRINDCGAKVLITADGGFRRGNVVALKDNADKALESTPGVEHVVVVERVGRHVHPVHMQTGRDIWWHEAIDQVKERYCPPESLDAEHPLYILYTSGTTGKPKGVLHTTAGYLVGTLCDEQMGPRPQGRRCLLVLGRYRLGDRAQLHRLWPAGKRRDLGDVRRHAGLPGS